MQDMSNLLPLLSGLLGVVLGAGLAFWSQRKQRQWALEDSRLRWRRERLERQTDAILSLIARSLTYLRLNAEAVRQGQGNGITEAALSADMIAAASVASIALADAELGRLFFEYASAVRQIRDLLEAGELTELEWERLLEEAQMCAEAVGQRVEVMLDEL